MSDPRTAAWYLRFAAEARGQSALFEEWATGVAGDEEVLTLIERLPLDRRQPNLVFAVSRLLGVPLEGYAVWREWLIRSWDSVASEAIRRTTQTNEPLRSAVLLPALGMIDGPIALLEVGASAGLCLVPDRYSYRYVDAAGLELARLDPSDGRSTVVLECLVSGEVPLPGALPTIVWRAGIDLNPLDVSDPDDALWLETLVWPEQADRLERIRAAATIVRAHPSTITVGDAVDALAKAAAAAPSDATLVVMSSAMLAYLAPVDRQRFIDEVHRLGARWISLEGQQVLPTVRDQLPTIPGTDPAAFVLALDGTPRAFASPHGRYLDWF